MRQGEDVFAWTHRRAGDCEIYFVASQVAERTAAELAFRVQGKQPEIWILSTAASDQPDRGGRSTDEQLFLCALASLTRSSLSSASPVPRRENGVTTNAIYLRRQTRRVCRNLSRLQVRGP